MKEIPSERIKRNRKVRFCSDECRYKEQNQRRAELRLKRKREGRCEGCGRKLPHNPKEGTVTRVYAQVY